MLKEIILNEIIREYDLRRAESEQVFRERELLVLRQVPQIAQLRRLYTDCMLGKLKQSISSGQSGEDDDLSSDKLYSEFKSQETRLLLENGFPEDFLTQTYRCSKCKDTGYIGWPVKEKCSCLTQKLIEKLYELSDYSELERQNFGTFDSLVFPQTPIDGSKLNQREYMVQLKDRLKQYAAEFPLNDRKTLLFSGKTGLGKTFLLNCMSKVILEKGYAVIRASAYNLSNRLFGSIFNSMEENQYLFDSLFDADLLIIDDLGTEIQRNNFTSEDLFNVLNERLLKNKHTFLSTNLGLSDLRERYSDRITSRLYDTSTTMLIKFMGNDIRLRHRQA